MFFSVVTVWSEDLSRPKKILEVRVFFAVAWALSMASNVRVNSPPRLMPVFDAYWEDVLAGAYPWFPI